MTLQSINYKRFTVSVQTVSGW